MTIKLIFQMACILRLQCNFLNVYFRCLLPVEMVDVEVQGENNARNSHVLEGQNITDHKVQPLDHKAPSLPHPHLKDENIFGIRGKAWSQIYAPTPNLATTNPAVTNPATTKHQHLPSKYQ